MKKYFWGCVLLLLLLLSLGACMEGHEHSYSTDFTSNDERHWRESHCGHGTLDDGEHSFGEGETVLQPTCQSEGSTRYTCTVCSFERRETIACLPHELEHFEAKAPLCSVAGWEAYDACKSCDYSTKSERYDFSAHDWVATENREESTCLYTGHQEYKCSYCERSKSETLPKGDCSFAYDCGPFQHIMQCRYCNKQQGSFERHTPDIQNTCTVCSYQLSCEGMEFELSEDGEYYILTNGGDVQHRYPSDSGYLVVPPYHNGLPVKVIGEKAMSKEYVRSVGSVYIFDHVERIGKYAFTDTLMGQIYLPDTLKLIDEDAFYSGKHISGSAASVTVYFGGTLGEWLALDFATLCSNPMKGRGIGSLVLETGPSTSQLIIPEGTTEIKPFAFAGCRSIREITLPQGLLTIGESAFDFSTPSVTFSNMYYLYRTSYHEIVIPDSVKTIGKNAFHSTSLFSVTLGRGLVSVGDHAFGNCRNLVELNNLSSIPTQALLSTAISSDALLAIHTEAPQTTRFFTDPNGFVFYEAEDGLYLIYLKDNSAAPLDDLVLPDAYGDYDTYAVHTYALYERDIKKLTIPDCVSSIGKKAFIYCPRLTELTIGDGVVDIQAYAFANCGTLAFDAQLHVTLGAGVQQIGDGAFYACAYLTSFEMPDTVKTIGASCFQSCSQLKTLRLSAALESIGEKAFHYCTSLEGMIIPAGVTTLKNCFFNCRLKWLVLNDTLDGLSVIQSWSTDNALRIYLNCDALPAKWGEDWNAAGFPVYLAKEWSFEDGVPSPKELSAA